jgi:hypothetical protein
VKHKAAHEVLALMKYRIFRDLISMHPNRFSQQLNGREYPCVQFVTRTSAMFWEWRNRFYRERTKIVPVDIARDLTPRALPVWLMDDGAADYAGLTFQTHSFTRAETSRLAAALREEYELCTTVRRNRGSYVLHVKGESIESLRQAVSPYVLRELAYKLVPRRSRTP